MKLVVGLGNPGLEYSKTRHNAGFMAVDVLIARHAPGAALKSRFHAGVVEAPIGGTRAALAKPTTFMNRSGQTVAESVRFYKADPIDDLIVVTDDVALPVGAIRLRSGGGTGGHNGLADIQRLLGTDQYSRLRIGIGAAPSFMDQADYVLGRFSDTEAQVLGSVLDTAADAIELFCAEGIDAAMNTFNTSAGRVDSEVRRDEKNQDGSSKTHPGWLGEEKDSQPRT